MGMGFWVIIQPDFGLAYDISNPSRPFSFRTGRAEAEATEPTLSFNETLAALREGGCVFLAGEPDDLDPGRCVFLGQKGFIESALGRKLVFLYEGEDAYTLYVPVKEGHVAWREFRDPT
jgi:hypothetical protein